MYKTKANKTIFHFLLILFIVSFNFSLNAAESYNFAITPQFPSHIIIKSWTPFINYLEIKTGKKINLVTYKSYSDFEDALKNEAFDFAYSNPFLAYKNKKYHALVRSGKYYLQGILVVKKNSSVKTLKDLNGKKISFPSSSAFAASLLLRAHLAEQEKIKFTSIYSGSHSNTYRSVALEEVSAGGGIISSLKKEPKELQDNLSIIYKTPPYPGHPIIVHSKIPKEFQTEIKKIIFELNKTKEGQEILNNIDMLDPVEANTPIDFKVFKNLKLDKYQE